MNTDLPAAVCAAATTSNIQHPTPNIELTTLAPFYSAFDVRYSVFDVAVSLPTKQLLNVLNATGLKVGVLLNFGRYKVEVKRLLKYWSGPRCCRFWRWPRRERSADIRSDLGQASNPECFRGQNRRNPPGAKQKGGWSSESVFHLCSSVAETN
jgi:hypothetical protein